MGCMNRVKGRWRWTQYKRQTDRGIVVPCASVCLGRSKRGIRRSKRWRRVRRISILARSSVCSDIWSISICRTWRVYGSHLLPSPTPWSTWSSPRVRPLPPPRNGHARCCRLCKRSLSTFLEVPGGGPKATSAVVGQFLVVPPSSPLIALSKLSYSAATLCKKTDGSVKNHGEPIEKFKYPHAEKHYS